MENRRKSRRYEDSSEDWPTYSRLFVVCEKRVTEENLQDAFSKFGTIQDIRMPRDHRTNEPKGVAYIKFSKTSEAASALEAMNFKALENSSRPIKVMVAANRSDIQSDDRDTEKYRRLFINIENNVSEDNLFDYFGQFGQVENVIIQKDRNTGESKGFAYIKFRKFSEAARAMEECDKKYRAIFAQPKQARRTETSFESNINSLATANNKTSLISSMKTKPGGFTRIHFRCSPLLQHHQIKRIFDIVPGMESCKFFVDLVGNFGHGMVKYANPISAAYAVEKLDHFEYPPGMKIFVRPDMYAFEPQEANMQSNSVPTVMNRLKNAIASTTASSAPDLAQLAEAIAEASKLIKMATAGVTDDIPDVNDLQYCSAKLPDPKPLADIDSTVAKRCFLVCKPQPPPLTVLRDVFCRFGDLINVYTLPNKTVGYARYASVEAADAAIKCLHGAEICGVRIKVIEAEERPDDDDVGSNKRIKYEY